MIAGIESLGLDRGTMGLDELDGDAPDTVLEKAYTAFSWAYDEGGVLRAESTSSLDSLTLTIAQADVGSLESVSSDYGSGSALKISDAELTSLDLDIIGQNTSSKAYDGSGVLRAESISSLESLTLDIGQISVGSFESVSRDYGKAGAP